jgi:transcriptional regulator with XRE-family HTH domain
VSQSVISPIPKDALTEQWYGLLHRVLGKLQAAFRKSGLTQEAIGRRIGKSPTVISRCLRGKENMTLRTMHEIARGMNCRLRIELDSLDEVQPANRPRRGEQQLFPQPQWNDLRNTAASDTNYSLVTDNHGAP